MGDINEFKDISSIDADDLTRKNPPQAAVILIQADRRVSRGQKLRSF